MCLIDVFFLRHSDQPEAAKHAVDIGHSPYVSQRLRPLDYSADFLDVPVCQQHRAPRKALAALPPVNPQLLCEIAASAGFDGV